MNLSPQEARLIVESIERLATYEKQGAKCPLCSAMVRVKRVRKNVRYHICWRCNLRFKSGKDR